MADFCGDDIELALVRVYHCKKIFWSAEKISADNRKSLSFSKSLS
jgi:hypothetical protein